MKLTMGQQAAAWAVVTSLFAGCGGDDSSQSPSSASSSSSAPTPSPAPGPGPAPAPTPSTMPTISAQPTDVTALTGDTPTFNVTATGGNLVYQWKKNGASITGATASSYTVPPAAWSDEAAQYVVVVTNSAGSVTSSAAKEHLKLSADQQAYESFAAGSGIFESIWSLNYTGATQSPTSNYMFYDYATLGASPLTHGPQTAVQQAPVNYTKTLGMPTETGGRYLKNGQVVLVPGSQESVQVSYVAGGVQVDDLAADNKTVAYSEIRSGYKSVPLTGLLHAAPAELTNPYNAIFFNAGILDTTTSWGAGAAYLTYTTTQLHDRYEVLDCTGSTTGTTPVPCNTGTTLEAALATGEFSSPDGITYHTTDGAETVAEGTRIWIAKQPIAQSVTGAYTVKYRVYFQLNGNVYIGMVTKDGTVMSSKHYRTKPSDGSTTVYLDYDVRLNSAATQSLVAGSLY